MSIDDQTPYADYHTVIAAIRCTVCDGQQLLPPKSGPWRPCPRCKEHPGIDPDVVTDDLYTTPGDAPHGSGPYRALVVPLEDTS